MIIYFKPTQIGEYTITAKRAALIQMPGECLHESLTADANGEILTCKKCSKQVSAWWVLMRFVESRAQWEREMESRQSALIESEKKGVLLRSAQRVEKAWRKRRKVPICPHCSKPILPTDGFGERFAPKMHALTTPPSS